MHLFLLFFVFVAPLIKGAITHNNGRYYISIEHFMLGFEIDIYKPDNDSDCREIGQINALTASGDDIFSDKYYTLREEYSEHKRWSPETIESFGFKDFQKYEWKILKMYPFVWEKLTQRQRSEILNVIINAN